MGKGNGNRSSSLPYHIFLEHTSKYEFISYPVELTPNRINHVLYRSFSSLNSLRKFKSEYGGMTFIKFGRHDITKPHKFDVLAQYAIVDSVEFKKPEEVLPADLIDHIKKS
ncbi:MAG TPA: hypothetical protein VNI77_11925 [Nitrososphaera sp.]|nr:hypothetical protein [Nitrososphaera sp.]